MAGEEGLGEAHSGRPQQDTQAKYNPGTYLMGI